jgi:N-acetylglucosaminyl-diphospho-decaprenol L-rhamnosyltransferase
MSFTAVTVLHDSAGPLPALLESLARFGGPDVQTVVVDTGSRDGGPAIAQAAGAEVVLLGANPGFGAACNAGLARARHAVTALVNPDVELLDPGLTELCALAAAHDALFVPRLIGDDGRPQRSVHPRPATIGALAGAALHAPLLPAALRVRLEPWRATHARTAGWAIAACLAARTDLLCRFGPFDPAQFLFYEDLDLCLRARAAGVPTVFVPTVAVRHAGGHSTRRAYAGEPHALLARRRREVIRASLGRRAALLDDATQALTFGTRYAARVALRRERERERQQLAAQLARAPR